jgi:hypothetical protein
MAAPEQGDKAKGIEFYGGYQVYSESGVDLTLLRANLQRPLEERLENNRRAVAFGLMLQQSRPRRPGEEPLGKEEQVVIDAVTVVKLLVEHGVQFVLVGGQAMRAQGSAHVTDDLDICYQRSPANLAALVAALSPIHPYLRGAPPGLPFRVDVPTLQAGLNFTLTTDSGDIDLLGEVSGIGGYDQVRKQSEERPLFGSTLRVLSVEGLIAAKKAAGRGKDKLHLLELEELKKLLDAAREEPAEGGGTS